MSLYGVPSVRGCVDLLIRSYRVLDLSSNVLSGTVPSTLSAATALVYLDLSNNTLSGIASAAITSLKMLTALKLSSNSFTSSVPVLSNLTGLV